jgi:predicted dinucleotide-utilizing enzyme
LEPFAGFEAVARLVARPAILADTAFCDEPLRLRARQVAESRDRDVEALSGPVGDDVQL